MGRLLPDCFSSRNLPAGFQAGRLDRWRRNGEKWWSALRLLLDQLIYKADIRDA
jgi:hypothetical protein